MSAASADTSDYTAGAGPKANDASAGAADSPDWKNLLPVSDKKDQDGRPLGALGHGEMWFHTD